MDRCIMEVGHMVRSTAMALPTHHQTGHSSRDISQDTTRRALTPCPLDSTHNIIIIPCLDQIYTILLCSNKTAEVPTLHPMVSRPTQHSRNTKNSWIKINDICHIQAALFQGSFMYMKLWIGRFQYPIETEFIWCRLTPWKLRWRDFILTAL